MKGLQLLGGGVDALLTTTATPTAQQRLARYGKAVARHPCKWRRERVAFGQILQDAIKAGYRVSFHTWQGQLPELWPPRTSRR